MSAMRLVHTRCLVMMDGAQLNTRKNPYEKESVHAHTCSWYALSYSSRAGSHYRIKNVPLFVPLDQFPFLQRCGLIKNNR
jgi:hypothetical protein